MISRRYVISVRFSKYVHWYNKSKTNDKKQQRKQQATKAIQRTNYQQTTARSQLKQTPINSTLISTFTLGLSLVLPHRLRWSQRCPNSASHLEKTLRSKTLKYPQKHICVEIVEYVSMAEGAQARGNFNGIDSNDDTRRHPGALNELYHRPGILSNCLLSKDRSCEDIYSQDNIE